MKKYVLLFMVLILSLSICACGDKADLKTNTDLGSGAGAVTGVEIATEAQNTLPTPSEEYLLFKETYTKSGNFVVYEYNEKGHIIKETTYKEGEQPLETVYTYSYNNDGSYSRDCESWARDYHQEYNSDGLLITETGESFSSNGKVDLEYVYDGNGNQIEIYSYGTLIESMEYNQDNLLIKHNKHDEEGKIPTWWEYKYDENGREIQKIEYSKYGDKKEEGMSFKWNYEYDEFGRVVEEYCDVIETGGTTNRTKFTYDENGGLCEKHDVSMLKKYQYRPMSECIAP